MKIEYPDFYIENKTQKEKKKIKTFFIANNHYFFSSGFTRENNIV